MGFRPHREGYLFVLVLYVELAAAFERDSFYLLCFAGMKRLLVYDQSPLVSSISCGKHVRLERDST